PAFGDGRHLGGDHRLSAQFPYSGPGGHYGALQALSGRRRFGCAPRRLPDHLEVAASRFPPRRRGQTPNPRKTLVGTWHRGNGALAFCFAIETVPNVVLIWTPSVRAAVMTMMIMPARANRCARLSPLLFACPDHSPRQHR